MIKEQYPYIDFNGNARTNLIKHWTDEEGKTLLQRETGLFYKEAVDIYPCPYTYEEVDEPVEEEEENSDDRED